MKNLNIDGVNISFSDTGGDGKAIVFLHYWGGSSRTWKYVIELLAPDYRCIAIDLKGWGDSDKDGNDFSLRTQAAIVEGFIAASDLADYALVGHSMGGKIAQIIASHRPSGLK